MSEDKNTERRGGGRYSRRTRRKFYYFKAWVAGLGPKKLTLLAAGAVLVIGLPIGAGVAMNRSAAASQSAGGSVQLRVKTATSLSGSPDAQSALESEGADGVDVLSITPPEESPAAASEASAPEATPEPTPEPTPTPEPDPTNTVFKYGMEAPVVAEIQERLMELGYMENDEPTEYYGSITESAVRLFQRQHGLNVDGCVGAETWAAMNADDAQHYTVMEGMDGTDVEELQTRLRELGYIDTVTGHFGEMTTEAVKKFQEVNKLTVDGKVGSKTREMLYSPDATANFHRFGEESDEVKEYQERLKKLGYLTTTPDGNYGKDTVMAVKRFQEINGLIADGFLGPNTMSLLNSSDAKANGLQLGMEGSDVTNVQKRLKELTRDLVCHRLLRLAHGRSGQGVPEAQRPLRRRQGRQGHHERADGFRRQEGLVVFRRLLQQRRQLVVRRLFLQQALFLFEQERRGEVHLGSRVQAGQ